MRLYSYAGRGLYAEQLERWLELFPRRQLHVIRSEDLFLQPVAELDGLADFLGIARMGASTFDKRTVQSKEPTSPLTPALRSRLSEHFAPHNQRLADLLGWTESWTATGVSEDPVPY
jgi:hypothetical protein